MSGSKRLRIVTITAACGVAAAIGLTVATTSGPVGAAGAASLAGATRLTFTPPTGIKALEAELYDETGSGQVLWGKNQGGPREIASITKVMVAYVVLTTPGLNLNRKITITAWEAGWGGPHVAKSGLVAGEKLTTRQLLYAMLLPSGADAAAALAVSYGPGTTAFIKKMNAAAKAIGMTSTKFSDYVGLSGDTASPAALLTLGQKAMSLPVFATVVATKSYALKALNGHRAHTWTNRNLLLGTYKYAIGIKTGWTPAAGECLLFMASYNGRVLVGVVLDSGGSSALPSAFADATNLLNSAYGLHLAAPAAVLRPAAAPLG